MDTQSNKGKGIPTEWPDGMLESQMAADASVVWEYAKDDSAAANLCCHFKALLARVRELEKETERLRRYEQAVKSLADQICSPKTTAEQMVAAILGEPMPGKRASR